MKIGIDIDDTITNTFDFLMPYIAEYFGIDKNYLVQNSISYSNLPQELEGREKDFERIYCNNYIINAPVKADASKYINKIRDLGHNICIITARNNNIFNDAYDVSSRQLKQNNIHYDKLVCSFDKQESFINEKIELLIDDSVDHCTKARSNGIDTLLFNSKENKKRETNLKRVDNWEDVYNYILALPNKD